MPQKSKLKPTTTIKALFQHWKDLPVIERITISDSYQIVRDIVRTSILKILRKGIFDDEYQEKRHLLTAKELLKYVNEDLDLDTKLGLSKLYYHLERLEEYELIDHLAVVKGNHRIKYYTRNAKFYLYDIGDFKEDKLDNFSDPIFKIIKHFNPEITDEFLKNYVDNGWDEIKKIEQIFFDWMKANHELINDLDIDPLELFDSFASFYFTFPNVAKHMKPLQELLSKIIKNE